MKPIILASQSPRRREILDLLQIKYKVEVSDIDETRDTSLPIQHQIMDVAKRKAEAVFKHHPKSIIIAADTIVYMNGQVFGKPKDQAHAHAMITTLQGACHQVITGVCIMDSTQSHCFYSSASVYFAQMSDAEIMEYIKTDEPYDKAGGYAIQGLAGKYIQRIDGDYYTIVGLPLHLVYEVLKRFN